MFSVNSEGISCTFCGIKVRMTPFLIGFLALFAVFNPNFAIGFAIVLFCFILPHELGHYFTAKYFGLKCDTINLTPIGGVADINVPPNKPKIEFWVAIMGPVVSVVIASISAIIYVATEHELAYWVARFNTIILLFNMLPIFPMDGGRILRSVMALWVKDYVKRTIWVVKISIINVIGLGVYALWERNPILGVICFFVLLMLLAEMSLIQFYVNVDIMRDAINLALTDCHWNKVCDYIDITDEKFQPDERKFKSDFRLLAYSVHMCKTKPEGFLLALDNYDATEISLYLKDVADAASQIVPSAIKQE